MEQLSNDFFKIQLYLQALTLQKYWGVEFHDIYIVSYCRIIFIRNDTTFKSISVEFLGKHLLEFVTYTG